ncbi:MAG: molybdate ABC transporter substrate-binding protein [Betaproteobacteria bacterium]
MRRIVAGLLAVLVPVVVHAEEVTVFAASSLQNAIEDVAALYQRATDRRLRLSFAASSVLARQIEQGAPASLFISADERWMDYLQSRKLIVNETRKALLGNRLVLVVPAGSSLRTDLRPGFDFLSLLGREGRWVTGDPSNVPVGRYAQQALTFLGAWDAAAPRLVRAENVRVALSFVERGETAAGVVYETDAATTSKVRVAGVFPAESHSPISYPVAVVERFDSREARDLLQFLQADAAREVFRRYGFSIR